MTAPPAGIVARGTGRRFGPLWALRHLDLEVRRGEVVGLVGPNGAGKTTTLRIFATLLRPTEGDAKVAGFDVQADPLQVRRRLGYLTGDTGLYGRLTPREMLAYFGALHALSGDALEHRIAEVTELLGLTPFLDQRCESLSTGQTQRVSIARAVLHDPPVLVLDEPTSGLDILAARDVLDFFRGEADRGKSVVLSTHIMAEVELICDRAVVIHHGRVLARGDLESLRRQSGEATLSRAFLAFLDRAQAPR